MVRKIVKGLVALVATAIGCATPPTPTYVPLQTTSHVATCDEGGQEKLFGEQVIATEIGEHIGRYMLIDHTDIPYSSLRLKCGECPVRNGFVAVYDGEAAAQTGSVFLRECFREVLVPTKIEGGTIEEHINSRYTSGRRIESGSVDLKPQ